jgi:hypothetical protein
MRLYLLVGMTLLAFAGNVRATDCRSNGDCTPSEYCVNKLGDCAGPGVCQTRDGCDRRWDPVCGCDGATYASECWAYSNDGRVASHGVCPPRTVYKACRSASDCAEAEFCHSPDGRCREAGVCETRAEVCPTYIDYVCGCDGKRYNNACEAYRAGVSIDHKGPCGSRDVNESGARGGAQIVNPEEIQALRSFTALQPEYRGARLLRMASESCIEARAAIPGTIPQTTCHWDECCNWGVCVPCLTCDTVQCRIVVVLSVCYPDLGQSAEAAVRECIPVAIAAAVGGFITGGPAGAAAAAEVALEECLKLKGIEWATQVRVAGREVRECG